MSNCPLDLPIPNTSLTYGDVLNGTHQGIQGAWYLRPDTGGAVLPWAYTIIVIVIHAPTVIIRVVRWEMVQTWSLAATLLTAILYTQAYVSTKFAPDQVLTWTPILLLIDAGSMLQLFVLVVEAGNLGMRVRVELQAAWANLKRKFMQWRLLISKKDTPQASLPLLPTDEPKASVTTTTLSVLEDGQTDDAEFLVNSLPEAPEPSQQSTTPRNSPLLPPALDGQREYRAQSPLRPQEEKYGPLCKDRAFWVASLALILLIAVLVLQILGLQAASKLVQADEPLISWCSPILQPFGKALIDGDCHIYAITAHQNSNGIGCLLLPGKQQKSWISLTLVISILALVMEAVDLLILTCIKTTKKMRGVKMRRPWCTMFGGLVVLGITLGFGLMYAQYLPPAITSRVTIVMSIQDMPFFFTGRLETAGLRGALLGWNDGVFSSWGNAYYGYPTT